MSLREKTGQLFMPAAFINDTEAEIRQLEKLIAAHYIGGLCFFHSRASAATNFEGAKKVVRNEKSFDTLKNLIQRYQKAAKFPLLIAIDAEWGLAMRIENTPQYPYAITLGSLEDDRTDLIYEVGASIARDCRAAGIHWNLAPCVDINNNPDNPVIGYRSFGEDKFKVSGKALAFIEGTQSEGVLTSIKHFPGHGDTATDSHLQLPLINKSKEALLENELYPFQKLIDKGVDSVMVGHLSVPALAEGSSISSSLSKEIITGLLRDEMGFDGVVISDALNMHAVTKNHPVEGELEWLAFDAGNDLLCFADHVEQGIETILKMATAEQINVSFKRIWRLKEKVQASAALSEQISVPGLPSNSKGSNATPVSDSSTNSSQNSASSQNLGSESVPHPKNADGLNRKIAQESLTLLKGSERDISNFRKRNCMGVSIPENRENPFFTSIQKSKAFKSVASPDGFVRDGEYILLAVFPPQAKPKDNFGFSREELIFINELIETENVILYLFGNPYVLNYINFEKTTATVIAYQNFEVFQDIAADHFLGNLQAKGKLPVTVSL